MPRQRVRKAIAMLELIFAIVVMGIAIMSAPTLISVSSKSVSVALQQEAINEALSRVNMILTYPWDENDTMEECIPPVLRVSRGDAALDENTSTHRRKGVPIQSNSRTFFCNGREYNASSIGSDKNDTDDIDDFNGKPVNLVVESSGSGGTDYIERGQNISINTSVAYIEDNASYDQKSFSYAPPSSAATPTTNIKKIDVNLSSSSGVEELQKTIILHAFSCNIGGFEYAHRTMP